MGTVGPLIPQDAVVVAVEMWGMVWHSGCQKDHFPISPSFFLFQSQNRVELRRKVALN